MTTTPANTNTTNTAEVAKTYMIEIANRHVNGRVVGNDYVVTRRPIGRTSIIARFPDRDAAVAWIAAQVA